MRASGPTGRGYLESLLFVVGHPLSHSLSPAMHNAVIGRTGLPLRYVAVQVPPSAFSDFLRVVRCGNFLGGNVTIPHKEAAAREADERSEEVAFCGAANVLSVRRGRLVAANTDGRGFMDALAAAGWGQRFRCAVLLGAGGAARGIAFELARRGARRVVFLNRDPARAERVAEALGRRFSALELSAGPLLVRRMRRCFEEADLVVNCTPLGLLREWRAFPIEAVKKGACFVDTVYGPEGTRLVRELRERGIAAMDGLPMLAHQAARSFAIWTGAPVPAAWFLAAARRAMAREPARANAAKKGI